jgi:hypothetical protein
MPQVLAWQTSDGQLFTDKDQYKRHQRRLAADRRRAAAAQAIRDGRAQFLATMTQVCSVDELIQFVRDQWPWFTHNAARHGVTHTRVRSSLLHLEFADLTWRDSVSNSHSAPAGCNTNWWRHQDQPLGYPGWKGRLRFSVSHIQRYRFSSGFFKDTPIRTGTGGGCSDNSPWATGANRPRRLAPDCMIYYYEYDVTLWSADWPGLTQTREKQVIWDRLSTPASRTTA